jgi:hypothetical protein
MYRTRHLWFSLGVLAAAATWLLRLRRATTSACELDRLRRAGAL